MDDLAAEARRMTGEPGPRCGVEVFLSALDSFSRDTLRSILDDRQFANSGIWSALQNNYSDAPSLWSIGNHRNKKCRCHR